MVLHYVAQTLKLVLPLMEHPSETFLAGLEEDLIKLIMKHGQMVSLEEGLQPDDLGICVCILVTGVFSISSSDLAAFSYVNRVCFTN